MHHNLFASGDEQEVYAGLVRDTKRDGRMIGYMDLVLIGAALYLARHLPVWDFAAVFAVAFVGMQRLNYFIDQSNRNFFMHMLDWQEVRDRRGHGR